MIFARDLGFSGSRSITRWRMARWSAVKANSGCAIEASAKARPTRWTNSRLPFEKKGWTSRTGDPITSLHLTWREPDRLVFEVNVAVPRTPEPVRLRGRARHLPR